MTTKIILRLLALLLMSPTARAACAVDNQATIPLQVNGQAITVPVEVNGLTATFILDTGALRSLVTPEAAKRLGLARDQWAGTTMAGIGGIGRIERPPNADPRSLSLAGVSLVRRRLSHDSSLAVAALPGVHAGNLVIDGLLGGDFLSLFDLDLDWPGHRLTLYQTRDCAGRFLPWTHNYNIVPATIMTDNAIIVTPMIDGKPLRALLDTGAGTSLLVAPGIYKLGLTSASFSADPAAQINGIGRRVVIAHRHQFHTLSVGKQTIDLPSIWVEPLRLAPIVDMVLGADWLADRRIWISFATKQVFVAAP